MKKYWRVEKWKIVNNQAMVKELIFELLNYDNIEVVIIILIESETTKKIQGKFDVKEENFQNIP